MNTTAIIIFGSLFIILHLINLICGLIRLDTKHHTTLTVFELLSPIIGILCGIIMIISQFVSQDYTSLLYSFGYSFAFFMNCVTIYTVIAREMHRRSNATTICKHWSVIKWILLGSCILNIILGITFGIVFN
jgi:hypothetical protein